jgi:threonine/homoserine/homoserine lactone efflux protein
MIEKILPYAIVLLFGFYSVAVSTIRLVMAETSRTRKSSALSLVGAMVMIVISLTAIYMGIYEILSGLTIALASVVLLGLNYIVFAKYSKPNGIELG